MITAPVLTTVLLLINLGRVVSIPVGQKRQLVVPWVGNTPPAIPLVAASEGSPSAPTSTLFAALTSLAPAVSSLPQPVQPIPTIALAEADGLTPLLIPAPYLASPITSTSYPSTSSALAQSASEIVSVFTTTSVSVSTISETTTATATATATAFSTYTEPPLVVTVTEPPTTATDIITIFVTQTAAALWSAPTKFTNLDSFEITNFACGQNNLEIADGIPSTASATALALQAVNTAVPKPIPVWNNASTVLQLFYPEGSYNPSNKPLGGADFYAAPVDMSNATNVTLEYSVFFPEDFDWVEGGKLPGLYGGHMQCSGGDNATTCFSTRMMWRKEGAGELYLYAPKNKQTTSLCSTPPESICDSTYGLSIGRGSFYFAPGAWTTIRQTVVLNTPGVQNGGFLLQVNGKQIMNHTDVFYRDMPSPPPAPSTSTAAPAATSGGLLSPILGPISPILGSLPGQVLQPLLPRQIDSSEAESRPALLPLPVSVFAAMNAATATASPSSSSSLSHSVVPSSSAQNVQAVAVPSLLMDDTTIIIGQMSSSDLLEPVETAISFEADSTHETTKPIGFSGIFFSTFFGGSTSDYATPKDQYTWFKDFAVTVNY